MQEVHRTELMPGVHLTCVQTKKFKSSYWALRLVTPLKAETAALNALLPQVLCRGTARWPDRQQLAAALEELYGGVLEPTVTKRGESQCFGFAATFLDDGLTPEKTSLLDREAELLGDLLLRPATRNGRLRADYVTSERANLMDDIKSVVNDKRQYALRRLVEEMCAGEDFGVSRLGSLAAAEKINVTRLDRHYRQLLPSAQIELYYCGSASSRRMELVWREALRDLPRQGRPELPLTRWRMEPGERRNVTDHLDVTQGKLVMGFRTGCTLSGRGYPALVVANALFGGTPTSKLFLNVRERLSLCYYASSGLDKHKGLLYVQCGVAFDNLERAEEEILRQLEAVQAGDFTDGELDAARRAMVRAYRIMADNQSAQADYWLSQSLTEIWLAPQELAQLLGDVTREEVIQAAQKLRLDTVYTLRGPEGEEAQP
ncbi:MAG: insulinase family protein [Clostridiales bacterium]|nr:insulinase family protein [Clostridiales bacterium]